MLALMFCVGVHAESSAPLPDPLSLQQAINLIDDTHPELMQARLAGQYAEVDLEDADAQNNIRLDLEGRLRWTETSSINPIAKDRDDHRLSLVLSKPVYDGGLTEARKQAAEMSGLSSEIDYGFVRDRYTITVMQQFLDIILADLAAARDTEALATAFVRMDRAEDRNELGQVSDIELLELQSQYQDVRVRLYNSEGEVRRTRQALALTLNRPGQQPSQITPPQLDVNGRNLLEFEQVLEKVMKNNPQLLAMNHDIAAARSKIEAARSMSKPRVTARLERAEQSRDLSSADKWRIGMEMAMPLYDGGVSGAAVKRAHLDVNNLMYRRQQYELQLRAEVRKLFEQFRVLKAGQDASVAFYDYRELYMDRSRALYDLEVKTDLGDSMIQISEAHFKTAKQQFEMALLLAQLTLLAGEPVMYWVALSSREKVAEGGGA